MSCFHRVLAALLLAVAFHSPAHSQVKWETNLDTARKVAMKTGKPLLVDFYASWCGPCKKMEEETFSSRTVRALLQRAVCVRIDIDKDVKTATQFEVESIPRVMLLPASGGAPAMDLLGFRDAEEFTAEMRRGLGLKADELVLPLTDSGPLNRVRQALQAKSFAALQASDPKTAAVGLNELVAALGDGKEAELAPLVGLLKNAGDAAVPALLRGMNHRYLSVRAGAYRALQSILRDRNLATNLAYDPWSTPAPRQAQLQKWTAWWQSQQKR